MKRKLIAFLLVAALMVSLGVTAAAGANENETTSEYTFSYAGSTYAIGLAIWDMQAETGMPTTFAGENGNAFELPSDTSSWTFSVCGRSTDAAGQPVAENLSKLIKRVSVTAGFGLTVNEPVQLGWGLWQISMSATQSLRENLTATFELDLDGDSTADTTLVQQFTVTWQGQNATDDPVEDDSEYTFEYDGEIYTIGLQEWANGEPMPMTFGEGYPGGGMRMTDEDFELEYVVCIKTGEPGAEEPAHNNIFAKIDSVTYTADVRYLPESAGELLMGEVTDVTRDTSDGTGNTKTKAFSISVPGTSYFDMDITATITMKLEGEPVTLTQTLNYGKPSSFIGMTTLRLDNYIDECDTTEELQDIIRDRESLWRFYAQKSGCSVDELMELTGDALKVVLPAGTYGDLSFDISDMTTTVGEFTDTNGNGSDRQIRFNGPVVIWGSDNGTTIGSLTYTSTDADGMSSIARINFDGSKTVNAYGLRVFSNETPENLNFGPTGVNNCTFNGYETAIISEGNGYAVPDGCTFTNNETAVYINCGDGVVVFDTITRCIFEKNKIAVYLQSLGKSCSPYAFRVTMCDFIGNDTEVNYQPAGKFYLFNNYYGTVDGKLKRKSTVVEGEHTTIKQGVWRDQSFKNDVTGYGIADEGVVINNDGKALDDDYLDAVTFDVIAADAENSETVGTWSFE